MSQCKNKTSGIYLPQFNLALSSGQTQVAITQNIHNQCQRLGFYDYLADTAKVSWSLPVGRYLHLTTIMPMSFHPCIQAGANDRDLLICGMCSTNIRDIIFRPCNHQYACVECVNNPRFHNARNQRDATGNYLKCPCVMEKLMKSFRSDICKRVSERHPYDVCVFAYIVTFVCLFVCLVWVLDS